MGLRSSHCQGVPAPTELSITTMCTTLAFMCVIIPGNLMVLLAVVVDPNHDLRTPFTMFVVNLAGTDLLVGAVVGPLCTGVHYREATGKDPLYGYCQFPFFVSCTASLLSLAGLTIERYFSITSPMWYRANASFTRAGKAAIFIWVLSFSISGIFFKVGFNLYLLIFANIILFCIVFIFLFSYVRIFLAVKNQVKEMREISEVMPDGTNRALQRALETESKLTAAYMIMFLVFLSCYVPSAIMIYVIRFCDSCSCEAIHWLRDLEFLFVVANSMFNPFVYAYRLPVFKNAFLIIIRQAKFWGTSSIEAEVPTNDTTTPPTAAAATSGIIVDV